jgi:ribonuclease HII
MITSAAETARLLDLHRHENEVWQAGSRFIGGIDEVGRGPLAGPVIAACVVIDQPLMLQYLNDSKKVTERRRVALRETICAQAVSWGIGSASVAEIDTLNIAQATRLAMQRALEACTVVPDALLIDAMRMPTFRGPQRAIIDGDALSAVIAAASIVAKVYRDALMQEFEAEDPRYGFGQHKGYGTKAHMDALRLHGPTVHHRKSFAPVRALI